jgi:hypothetical protein
VIDPTSWPSPRLQNVVRKFWKPRGQRSLRVVTDEEKARLRTFLLQPATFDIAENRVSLQLAVLHAQMARFDFPRDWPELFPGLLAVIQSGSELQVRRAMLSLNDVLKELSSKRLPADKRKFAEVPHWAQQQPPEQHSADLARPIHSTTATPTTQTCQSVPATRPTALL